MKCTVHGHGLYAWVTAVRLAQAGHHVILLGDEQPTDEVLHEPDLMREADEMLGSGRLTCYTGVTRSDDNVHWLALDGDANALVWRAAGLLQSTQGDLTVICLNTTPVGLLDSLQHRLTRLGGERRVRVLGLPLFIRAGRALADFSAPDQLLIGEPEAGEGAVLMDWLRPYSRNARDTQIVPLAAAELIKFGINAMLATRVSFMNELAGLTERLGIDIEVVRQGLASDPRVGGAYLEPGCGFGGPSFTDELFAFAETLREAGGQPGLLDAVLRINAEQRDKPFRLLWRHFDGQLAGRTIAVWGASYKPGTASVDHSPVHPLLKALHAQGACVRLYDPLAMDTLRTQVPEGSGMHYAESAESAIEQADALVLLTAWPEFFNPDYRYLAAAMRHPVIVDGRNVFDPQIMAAHGFRYYGIGRGAG